MREILFRGKWIDNGEWVYGNLNYGTIKIESIKDSYYISDFDVNPWDKKFYPIIPESVGQYTGLTDKNGKKIFEGDICNINIPRIDGGFSTHNNCLCSFEYGKFMFSSYSDIYFCMGNGYGYPDTCHQNIEVIGNIHDNPELLEVTE